MGCPRKELEAQLKKWSSDELASGTMTEAKMGQIRIPLSSRADVPAGVLQPNIPKTANLLNKAFPIRAG